MTSLDEDVAEKVLDALRLFITNRSLFSDSKPSSLLSRTVIFSTTTVYERALEVSDDVIVVGTPTGSATLIRGDDKKAAPSAALLSQSGNGEEEGSPIGSPAGRRNMLRKMCSEPDWNRQNSLSEMSEEHLHDLLRAASKDMHEDLHIVVTLQPVRMLAVPNLHQLRISHAGDRVPSLPHRWCGFARSVAQGPPDLHRPGEGLAVL